MIKVLYLIESLEIGGAQRVIIELATSLDPQLFKPIVCCLSWKGELAESLEKQGIEIIVLNKKPGMDLSIIPRLAKLLKEKQIDILHTHLWTANFWGRITALFFPKLKVIATEHNVDVWKSGFHFFWDGLLVNLTYRLVLVSQQVKDFYRQTVKLPEKKMTVIRNGIKELPSISAPEREALQKSLELEGKRVLFFGGRLEPQKGLSYLLPAFARLCRDFPQLQLLIAGTGSQQAELQNLADSLKLGDQVKFLGARTDMGALLDLAELVVLPSSREGLSILVLEAMSKAKPVVATRVGGNPECITEGENGLLVSPGEPEALYQALKKLLENPELIKKMGEKAREKFENEFTSPKMQKAHQELYLKALKIVL